MKSIVNVAANFKVIVINIKNKYNTNINEVHNKINIKRDKIYR